MQHLTAARRQADLEYMASTGVDVLVIGGGITGAGIALDAVTRGYRTGLIERDDFASGTSGWSTKLVHGGIRYLPQGDVALVQEALIERGRLLANAPHLVHALPFVLPLYGSSRRPVGFPVALPGGIGLRPMLNMGLTLYDVLAGRYNLRRHRHLTVDEVMRRAPMLRSEGLKGGFLYTDGQTDDARLTLAVIRSAAEVGARIANHAEVVGFVHGSDGRLQAAQVRLNAPGDAEHTLTIPSRHIINATGVFAEQIEQLVGDTPHLDIQPSKGVHIVVRRAALSLGDDAVVLPETSDGRIIFLVPWRSRIIIGTTDTGGGDLDRPLANDDDVAYLLEHLNRSIRHPLTLADIVSTYAGYRPLLRMRGRHTPARLSRTHAIVAGEGGLLSIAGGKLTTYRRMAEEVVDRIDAREGIRNPCATDRWPLAGAVNWPGTSLALVEHGIQLGLSQATIHHLDTSYGALAAEVLALVAADTRLAQPLDAELPAIMAEVAYAAQAEMALTLTDVLERRQRLGIEAADHGVGIAPAAAAIMASVHHWDDAQCATQIAAYTRYATRHDAGLMRSLTLPPQSHTLNTSHACSFE